MTDPDPLSPRLKLQALLEELLGSSNVYFQPPASLKMMYPCIRYERSNMRTLFADNKPYTNFDQYTITVIDGDPDSTIPTKIKQLPRSNFSRHFVSADLNHDVFTILV